MAYQRRCDIKDFKELNSWALQAVLDAMVEGKPIGRALFTVCQTAAAFGYDQAEIAREKTA